VVVIGTGAGGAVVAKELAELGHAVVLLEEGKYFTRKDFSDNRAEQSLKLYRNLGALPTLGNTTILLPTGRTVGGSTTINSGTCFRVPEWVLDHWQSELGLTTLTKEHLEPYYRRSKRCCRWSRPRQRCSGHGSRHRPRLRKARPLARPARAQRPGVRGQRGLLLWLPYRRQALDQRLLRAAGAQARAQLFTGAVACEILTRAGVAIGVRARAVGTGRSLTVRAKVVVVAAGALATPLLLRGVVQSSMLGRNLSVHPASGVMALFDEPMNSWDGIPRATPSTAGCGRAPCSRGPRRRSTTPPCRSRSWARASWR